jgi:hypothetical protein
VEELFQELQTEFIPENDKSTQMKNLIQIKQGKKETVKAYIIRFKDLLLHVPTYDNDFMKELFLNGLLSAFRNQVLLQRPQTLEEAYLEATNIEDSFGEFLSQRPTTPLPSALTNPPEDPDAMEIDAISQRLGPHPQSINERLGPQPRPIEQRLGNRANPERRVCFECGKSGHIARNCYDRRRRFQAGDFSRRPAHPNSLAGRPPLPVNQASLSVNDIQNTSQGNEL